MNLTVFFLVIACLQVSAVSFAQKITLSVKNVPLSATFKVIEQQSKYKFFYDNKLVKRIKNVSVDLHNASVTEVLDELTKNRLLTYSIIDNTIVIQRKKVERMEHVPDAIKVGKPKSFAHPDIEKEHMLKQVLFEAAPIIEGKVVDEAGEALPGVSILVKGTQRSTSTNIDGNFSIDALSANAILVFSFVGYETQEIDISGKTFLSVIMTESISRLDEVVVVGYGEQKKATLTGSISSITGEDIVKAPTPNISNSLAGLMPGLVTMNRSGKPGDDNSSFLVRGNSTTGSNSPLVLVDGVAEPGWQRINPNDIESVSILKDAAAAIYGVQAANGVILITTKRGVTGKPILSFTYNQALVQPTRIPEMASSATLAEYGNDYLERTGFEARWTEEQIQKFKDGSDPLRYPNTDWAGGMLKKFALQESSNLNIRGGAEKVRYSLSTSYQHRDDIIKNGLHDFKNFSIRSNIDADINDYITVSLDLNAGIDDVMEPSQTSWFYIYAANPQYPIYWPGGYPSNIPSDYGENPAITHTGGAGYDDSKVKRFNGKFSYNIRLPWVEGLGVDGYFATNDNYLHRKRWRTPWEHYGYDFDTGEIITYNGGYSSKPELQEWFTGNNSYLINSRVKFQRQFDRHYLNTFIAVEQSRGRSNTLSAYRKDFLSSAIDELFAGSAANLTNDGFSSENARRNVFGRVSYNYMEKYLLDFNFRYDGSYRFPKDGRWGFFPGLSVAWRVSEEKLIKDNLTFINDLKLRASHGEIGNDAISAFQYLQQYNLRSIGYHFGAPTLSAPQAAVYSGVSPNPNITWEVAAISNLGLDGILFNQLLGFSVDVFKQRRSNILTTRGLELPYYTGLQLPNENIGIVENKGIELELSHFNKANDFTYRLEGNISFSRSNVVDVSEAQDVPDYQKAEGHILGAGLYYDAIGIFRTKEELESKPVYPGSTVGDLIYRDVNDDGLINNADKVRMDKSVIPEITYGFNLTLNYKNFGLFANFAGQGRAWWYIHQHARVDQNGLKELLENRYTPGSMDSKYPWIPQFAAVGTDISGMPSTMWLQNAAFLRLKTLNISYDLPQGFLNQFKIQEMRVFCSGSNLLTFSEIKWFDPEGSNERGLFYPQSKVYNLGVQVKF